jgi:hypothetical protein
VQPTIGRIVHYRLSDEDVGRARALPTIQINPVSFGDTYPAIVVRAFGAASDGEANLQVFLDGQAQLWVTSAKPGTGPGTWSWPPRA